MNVVQDVLTDVPLNVIYLKQLYIYIEMQGTGARQ
jgi:hypothetical protein